MDSVHLHEFCCCQTASDLSLHLANIWFSPFHSLPLTPNVIVSVIEQSYTDRAKIDGFVSFLLIMLFFFLP